PAEVESLATLDAPLVRRGAHPRRLRRAVAQAADGPLLHRGDARCLRRLVPEAGRRPGKPGRRAAAWRQSWRQAGVGEHGKRGNPRQWRRSERGEILPTNQKVGCSNHPGRTSEVQVVRPSLRPSSRRWFTVSTPTRSPLRPETVSPWWSSVPGATAD